MRIPTLARAFAASAVLVAASAVDAASQASTRLNPPSREWRSDVSCTAGRNAAMTVAGEPVEAQVPGCFRAFCTQLADGRRVCNCLKDAEGDDAREWMRVEEGGRVVNEWPTSSSHAGSDWFRVLGGDLDADGKPETVVAQLRTVSNGLGVEYWSLTILDGRDPARTPLRAEVEDFDPSGSFVRPREGGSCRLLATRWDALRDPRRGPGMYLIGQWMRYEDGRFLHDTARPVVARRLLFSFDRSDVAGAPFTHLRDRRAETLASGRIADLPPLAGSAHGTIRAARGDTLEVVLESGRTLRYPGWPGEPVPGYLPDGSVMAVWLVDALSRRAYPAGYFPADPAVLEGKGVTLRVYETYGSETHLLLLGP